MQAKTRQLALLRPLNAAAKNTRGGTRLYMMALKVRQAHCVDKHNALYVEFWAHNHAIDILAHQFAMVLALS
ncbi:hypothetical protein PtrV1_12064 [Pyrenophora tritici-repentis]|nr:hypothetical protein PtrV1_12064 [Pyrenophora tritici-repentis]